MGDMERELAILQENTSSPRKIALTRRRWLVSSEPPGGSGLPVILCRLLRDSLDAFLDESAACRCSSTSSHQTTSLEGKVSTRHLRDCLQIHLRCSRLDPCLGEELGSQGTHVQLRRLIQCDDDDDMVGDMSEPDADVLMELQDVACEIAALYNNFPMKASPCTREMLLERLPLTFTIRSDAVPSNDKSNSGDDDDQQLVENEEIVLIHQVTARQSAQEDVGFVMWPSAVVLSRWLVSNPSTLTNSPRILEIGAGCGLVGLLAARVVQKQRQYGDNDKTCEILLSDFNQTVLENLERNIALNEVGDVCHTVGLDFYQQSGTSQNGWNDTEGQARAPVDVILAADMICQASDALYAANTIHDALKWGGRAYVVCADAAHRFGVDHFVRECHRVGLRIQSHSVADSYPGLIQGSDMHKTAGFVDGMNLTMFVIEKPNQ